MADGKPATLKEIVDFFGKDSFPGGLAGFRKEWNELTPDEQTAIKVGIGNGTLTY